MIRRAIALAALAVAVASCFPPTEPLPPCPLYILPPGYIAGAIAVYPCDRSLPLDTIRVATP